MTPAIGFDRKKRCFTHDVKKRDVVLIPTLEGELRIDDENRKAAARDFGCVISRMPVAVLRPRSHDDVVKIVRFAAENGIGLTVRGQGHSIFGQTQSENGLLIEMASLCVIHEIGRGHAIVDAGCTWNDVLVATLATSQRPIVITGYSKLSVGGTLSVGGLSGMSHQRGCQVDHVLELLVVTGSGELMVCSETENRDLFEAVLAGQGQCAVIVRAKIALERAKARTMDYTLIYPSLSAMLAAMDRLLEPERKFDIVWGGASPTPMGMVYPLFANKHYEPGEEATPDAEVLFAGVPRADGMPLTADRTFLEYIEKIDQEVQAIPIGGGRRRLWVDMFLGREQLEHYAQSVFDSLAPEDWGDGGLVLFFPLTAAANTRPLLRLPKSTHSCLFDFFRNTIPIEDDQVDGLVRQNRVWYEDIIGLGGTVYPIGAIPMTMVDWRAHYGDAWPAFERAKRKYDPASILGVGLPIFENSAIRGT